MSSYETRAQSGLKNPSEQQLIELIKENIEAQDSLIKAK